MESLFNKVAGLHARNFIKKRLQYRCFIVNIAKCLRTAFFIECLRWLLVETILICKKLICRENLLTDSNVNSNHNYLVRKRTLNHLGQLG